MRSPTAERLQNSTLQQLANVPAADVLGSEPQSVTMRDIVDGSVAGGTNDATLRFNVANDAVVGDVMTVTHDATDGDSVTISERGTYEVRFTFSQAASSTAKLGLSANVAAAGLTDNPVMTTAGMLDVGGAVLPAATSVYHHLATTLQVSDAEADAGLVVRFHGTDGSDGVVPDATILDNTECHVSIRRVADFIA
jgi:hypothetical protein